MDIETVAAFGAIIFLGLVAYFSARVGERIGKKWKR